MPPTERLSTCQSPKVVGTRSASLNGPRSSAIRLVGTMAWPETAAAAIRTAAIAARRVRTGSDFLHPRAGPGGQPAKAAVGRDDEHQRRHEQHHPGESVQEALARL